MAGRDGSGILRMTQSMRLAWWRRAALAVLWAEFAAITLWAGAAVLAAAVPGHGEDTFGACSESGGPGRDAICGRECVGVLPVGPSPLRCS